MSKLFEDCKSANLMNIIISTKRLVLISPPKINESKTSKNIEDKLHLS